MGRRPRCPQCDSREVLPIKYGYPGPEMMEDAQTGKIKLGGCVLGVEMARWYCKECENEW